ncbi:MAG: hypothetical protein P8Y05_01665 [Deinococcales bacterium]
MFAQAVRLQGGVPRRFGARLGRWVALLAALAWLTLTPALAQNSPTVTLNANVLRSGGTVTLDASGLKADTAFTVTLTAPDGSSDPNTVRSDGSGALHFEKTLEAPGTWTVHLSGPGIDAPLSVEVSQQPAGTPGNGTQPSAPSTPSQPSPSQPTPSQPTPSQPSPLPPTPSQPAPSQPAPSQPQAGAPLDLSIEQGSLVARQGGQEAWRLDFPADSGQTAGVVQADGRVYLGHGNSLLVLDPANGSVQARYAVPAQVADVATSGNGVSVTVAFADGTRQSLEVGPDGIVGTVRFGSDPAIFGWLQHEAQVADPAKRLQQDPTNPWLYVAVAKQASDAQGATADYQGALNHAATFYERAQLARTLYAAGQTDLAKQAMDGALRDYVDRGYAAELLTDPQLRDAYGFPLPELEAAVGKGDFQAASFWAPWAYRMSTPAVPATQAALLDYSRALRADGQRSEASLWRARAHEGNGFRLGRALRRAALGLGHAGWYGVAALLVAMVFLHLTLIAKYWRPQSLALKQRKEGGRSPGRVPRLFAIRYYSFTEKLVLVLMFAAVLALASLAGWAHQGDRLPVAWRSGTLASVPARNAMSSVLRSGQVADFVQGYGAQVAGDSQAAAQAYRGAGDYAPALNNLGALENSDALYQKALDVARDLPEALFNLGRGTDPSRLHAAYAADVPLLAVPSETLLRSAVAGSFQDALGAAFTNPWAELIRVNPLAIPNWLWDAFVVLFLAWVAVTVVYLVAPRPRLARNAPRTAAYHLLALLIPGSGLSDELWGVLLLVPWAIFGIDTLLHYLPLGAPAGIPLATDYAVLAVIYALNIVSFLVELTSYRRRMAELRRSHPETAQAYGMRVSSEPSE